MKRVRLYSCLLVAGAVLSLPVSFGEEKSVPAGAKEEKTAESARQGAKKNTEEKKETYTDREMSEALMNALITLAGQITKALGEVKDKKSAEDCIVKLEIIKKVKDKIQEQTLNLSPPDAETSRAIMNTYGPRLQAAFVTLNKEVTRIQKERYYNSVEFRTALEGLLKAPASGMPIL